MGRHYTEFRYSEEHINFLKEYAPGHSMKDITEKFNNEFSLDKTVRQLGSLMKRHKIKTGRDTRFVPGQPAYNKGKKVSPEVYAKMERTMFKKGNIPTNHRPVGSERINVDGYIEYKYAEPNKWILKHKMIWQQVFGDVPEGYVIVFKDQNKLNCNIDNLMLVNRKYMPTMSRMNLFTNDAETNETCVNLVKLIVETNAAKNKVRC